MNILINTHAFALFLIFTFACQVVNAQGTFTANASGEWGNAAVWSFSGSDADGIPDGDDDVIIPDGITVSLSATQACDNLVINFGGMLLFNSQTFSYTDAYIDAVGGTSLYISKSAGSWSLADNWYNNSTPTAATDNIFVANAINSSVPATISGDITISSEGRLEDSDAITIGGAATSLFIDGTLYSSGDNVEFSADKSIVGRGTINANGDIRLNNNTITIESSASISMQTDVDGTEGILSLGTGDVINNGTVVFAADIASVEITNNTDAYVRFQNETSTPTASLFSGGTTLDASASGNTIEYAYTAIASTVLDADYHHLKLSTTAGNTIDSDLTVSGNLIVNATTTVNSGRTLSIGGDWQHIKGGITYTGSTVVFNGSEDQTISSSPLKTVSFNNLTVNKSTGLLSTAENISVEGTLTMISGDINLDETKLTVGTSTASSGTLTYSSGFIIGEYEKWIGSSGTYQFPLGNSSSASRTLEISVTTATMGSLSAYFTASAPGQDGLSGGLNIDGVSIYNTFSRGYWTLTADNSFSGSNYTIVAEAEGFDSFEFDSNDDARLVIRTGTDWIIGGQTSGLSNASASPKTVTGNSFTITLNTSLDVAVGSAVDCEPADAGVISGDAVVCTDDLTVYSVNQVASSGTSEFKWTVTEGALISGYSTDGSSYTAISPGQESVSGLGYRYIQVTSPSAGTTSASVSVSEKASGCGYGSGYALLVTVGTVAPDNIDGRSIVAEGAEDISYSVPNPMSGYTYTWSVTNGTIAESATTTASGVDLSSITVDWGAVTGTQTVSVIAEDIDGSCPASSAVTLDVVVHNAIDSNKDGDWDDIAPYPWEGGATPIASEDVRIGTEITLTGTAEVDDLIVKPDGTLKLSNQTIIVNGDIEIYGSIVGPGTIQLSGLDKYILGTSSSIGSPTDNVNVEPQYSMSILSGTDLTVYGNINLANNASVTNDGKVSIIGDLTGGNAIANWTNVEGTSANPTVLSVSGELLATGVLQADARYNTVTYTGTGSNIKQPTDNTYHDLTISNSSGIRSTENEATLTIAGNLTISSTVNFRTDELILYGNEAQTIDLSGSIVLYEGVAGFPSLTVNNTSGITLNNDISLSNDRTLTLTNGVVSTGTNTLSITNNAVGAIIGSGSEATHVNGILRRATASASFYDFPVGTGNDFKRVEIQPADAASNTFQVQPFNTGYIDNITLDGLTLEVSNNATISGIEYWDISHPAGSSEAIARLYWDDAAESEIDDPSSDLVVAHWTGTAWESKGGTINSSAGYVESGSLDSFSPYTFGSPEGSSTLPVEMISFTAQQRQESVQLEWVTASETNNSHFVVQRSTDGVTFIPIGQIEGTGNSTTRQYYKIMDQPVPYGTVYYRLQQVDYDGTTTPSKVVAVAFAHTQTSVTIHPNPSTDRNVTITATGLAARQATSIQLVDVSGVTLRRYVTTTNTNGTLICHLKKLHSIPPGLYYTIISTGRFYHTEKLIIQQ